MALELPGRARAGARMSNVHRAAVNRDAARSRATYEPGANFVRTVALVAWAVEGQNVDYFARLIQAAELPVAELSVLLTA